MKNAKVSNIRSFAILVVILGHCIIIFDPEWRQAYGYNYDYDSTFLYKVKCIINTFQMELFYGISGFCFFYTINKGKSFKQIIRDKIWRILIPYVSIAFLWMIPLRLTFKYPNYTDMKLMEIITNVFMVREVGHLWFLPVLFVMFVVASLTKNVRNIYILAIIISASFFLSCLSVLIANYTLRLVCKYFFFFYAGYLLNMFMHIKKPLMPLFITMTMLVISLYLSGKIEVIEGMVSNVRSIIICSIIALLSPCKTTSVVKYIDSKSFSLYLLHSPLLIIGYQWFKLPPHLIPRCS